MAPLLRSQKAEIFQLVEASGMDPSEFAWDTDYSAEIRLGQLPQVERFVHTRTGAYYVFDNEDGQRARFSPGQEHDVQEANPGNWGLQRANFTAWLGYLRRELDTPDLWAELGREQELSQAAAELENTPFTEDEQAAIATQLNEIKEMLIQTRDLDQAQTQALEERVTYLTDAAGRLGRRDWLTIFMGSFVQLAIQAIIPTEAFGEVMRFAARGLAHLFGADIPELPGPL